MITTYLKQALSQAQLRQGYCAPNPSVGCVIVKAGEVIAAGNHQARGEVHAEVAALNLAGASALGADVYVTLAPCTHTGLTPPCVEALIAAKVASVTYAFEDPNSTATGAIVALAAANIPCQHVPLPEIDAFYSDYAHWVQTGRSRLTSKLALSLDGCYAHQANIRALITGEALQQHTMQQRERHDAIITSVRTVQMDNPLLSCRLPSATVMRPIVVLDAKADCQLNANIFQSGTKVTLLHSELADNDNVSKMIDAGVACIEMACDNAGRLDATALPRLLGHLGYHHGWVETGSVWLQAMLKAEVLDKLLLYYGNTVMGDKGRQVNLNALNFDDACWHPIGDECYCEINLRGK